MSIKEKFVTESDELLRLCSLIVGIEYVEGGSQGDRLYEIKFNLSDGSWVEISGSHEDGELMVVHVLR